MYAFETQMHALGVYFQIEVTFEFHAGDPSANVADTVVIVDVWLLGAYPEGCESVAVRRNDYVAIRERAEIGYISESEMADLESRCWEHLERQCDVAPEAAYE
jgi:hypothetical protein